MKEIKAKREIEEVIGYESTDGIRFSTEEECRKYEKTAKGVICAKALKYRIVESHEEYLFQRGTDNRVEIFDIKDDTAVDAINMYISFKWYDEYPAQINEDYIGKKAIIIWNYDEDYCDLFTIDSLLDDIKSSYESLISPKESK